MQIDQKGWLRGVSKIPSENFNERPQGSKIRLLVIHCISLPPGIFGGNYVEQFFTNRLDSREHEYFQEIIDLQVSAHCYIRRDGQILQFVSFDKRAWHAGVSSWHGEVNCNDFSVGIELEGTEYEPYEDRQYHQLAKLVITLRKQYPRLSEESICAHSDIAPGRKTDPGPSFDWQKLTQIIKQYELS